MDCQPLGGMYAVGAKMNLMMGGLEGRKFQALVFSIVLATIGYLAFSLWGGWRDVVAAFGLIGLFGTAVALGLSLVNYGLRFWRWQLYLSRLGYVVTCLPSLRIYLSGFALTTTPGKAGEAFRGVLLKQRGLPFPVTLAAFFSERLSDLVAVVILTMVGLAQYPPARPLVFAGMTAIVLLMICLCSQTVLDRLGAWGAARSGRVGQLLVHTINILLGARRCHSPGLLLVASVLSLVAWGAEALAFYLVLEWLGADISLSIAVFVYALSMLAGALSFLPGGLGGAEAVMVSLLLLKGMDMPSAVAATVFIRLATLWFAVVLGLLALLRSRAIEPMREVS